MEHFRVSKVSSTLNCLSMNSQLANISIEGETLLIISLNGIDLYCNYCKSEDSNFIIAFCDGDPRTNNYGFRKTGKGIYFLIKGQSLIVSGQVERPNDGKVGNNGNFIINDWLFTEETKSVAYSFNDKGQLLIKKNLKANLLMNSISKTGDYAFFVTAFSNNSHNNIGLLYNLETKDLIWKKPFGYAIPALIEIKDNENFKLLYTNKPTLIIDWNWKHIG